MINFACKEFDLNEVIKCSLSLRKSEFKAFKIFIKNPEKEHTTEELAKKLGVNQTTTQRAVKKLHETKIIIRRQENLTSGGYKFYYQIRKKEEIKTKIIQIISKWTQKVEEELEKI